MPNNKAPGLSDITYKMLKKLNTKAKKILKEILHICLLLGKIPNIWKLSNIYPIPKKEDWGACCPILDQ